MQNNNTLDNHYNIIQLLAQGPFSRVYLVTNMDDNNQYAARVEINNPNNQNNQFNFQHELQMTTIASALNSPYIVRLNANGIGTLLDQGIANHGVNYMILDYYPRGSLFDYLNLGGFTERHAKFIFKKILLGVKALHEARICHRDLKLNNILLD